MNQIIVSVALMLVVCGYVHAKCDMMTDFKEDFEEIKKWAEEECKKSKYNNSIIIDIDY